MEFHFRFRCSLRNHSTGGRAVFTGNVGPPGKRPECGPGCNTSSTLAIELPTRLPTIIKACVPDAAIGEKAQQIVQTKASFDVGSYRA